MWFPLRREGLADFHRQKHSESEQRSVETRPVLITEKHRKHSHWGTKELPSAPSVQTTNPDIPLAWKLPSGLLPMVCVGGGWGGTAVTMSFE